LIHLLVYVGISKSQQASAMFQWVHIVMRLIMVVQKGSKMFFPDMILEMLLVEGFSWFRAYRNNHIITLAT